VSFSHIEGYTEPAPQTVDVVAGAITTLNANFTQRGELRVETNPSVDAQITVDGTPTDEYGMWTDVPAGSHTVCFGKTAGYDPPACQTVNVTAGNQSTVTGTYTADANALGNGGVGLLRVITNPALPSQISINGVIADSWGLNWLEEPPGSYTITFSHIEGYTDPAPQTVAVSSGQTTTVMGTFTQRAELQVLTNPAVPAEIVVNGYPTDNWGMWTDIQAGTTAVCFEPVAGYANTPPCQTVTTMAGNFSTITGAYS
jgi:hypothetical protein